MNECYFNPISLNFSNQYPYFLCLHRINVKVQLCDPDILPGADPDVQVFAEGKT